MIVIPALHPAHDVIVRVDALEPGLVQRVGVEAMTTGVGGKAVNVALAIAAMDVRVRLVVCAEAAMHERLRVHAAGLPRLELTAVSSPVATRTDIAIVDATGRLTVINGTTADPGPDAIDAVVDRTLDGLADGDVVVLSGSTPDGTGAAHAEIAVAARGHGGRVIVDASGPGLAALLETQPAAVKISADEAHELMRSGDTALDGERPPTLAAVPIVGITDGAGGLRAWLPDGRAVRVTPPPDLPVVATLGAGDAVTAGLAIALANGVDPLDGFILGTAMAASTLDHLGPSIDRVAAERLRASVHVSPLDRRP
jgi:fructose-1-phosphate kinase PfkB-like protein